MSTVREVVLFPHLSLSQDEVFREVDWQIWQFVEEDISFKAERSMVGGTLSLDPWSPSLAAPWKDAIRKKLAEEVSARVTDGELLRRIGARALAQERIKQPVCDVMDGDDEGALASDNKSFVAQVSRYLAVLQT